MRAIAWPATDVGRVRSHNEDSYLLDSSLGLYLVADGMGGHAGGAHASQLCVDVMAKEVRSRMGVVSKSSAQDRHAAVSEVLRAAVNEASRHIYEQSLRDPRLQGMGTTLTGLLVYERRAYIVHVGDSRAFLLRGGVCRQLTEDHSWVNEQIQAGLITEEEAAYSDLRHIITRSVGFEAGAEPDIVEISACFGDAFLLCSDGFSNYVKTHELASLGRMHWYSDLPGICTDLANARGGDDNVTVVVVMVANDREQARAPFPATC